MCSAFISRKRNLNVQSTQEIPFNSSSNLVGSNLDGPLRKKRVFNPAWKNDGLFCLKIFLTELSYLSVIAFVFFFLIHLPNLSELWIPWLHEPDRCSAAHVRVVLASSACQEASALLKDHCSHRRATRQKNPCHRENAFLILGNWKPVADKPIKCHATVPLVHPYLVF